MPAGFTIVALSRSPLSDEAYRNKLREGIDSPELSQDTAAWDTFAENIHYLSADFHEPATYARLQSLLSRCDREKGTGGNRIYYLATAPSDYVDITRNLGAARMSRQPTAGSASVRIIIEKPFGRDLVSARALNREVNSVFNEQQVYRIDHYLGKETVQNLLVFRFANGIFEHVWNHHYVDHVQITAAESIGVGSRGSYYEEAGALRDMIQNHIMQLLALVAMEPPPDFEPNSVRDEKAKVLRSIRPFNPDDVARFCVRGQYGPGFVNGKPVGGYRDEKGVKPGSTTETYAAIRFAIDNWRWGGVPFYVRSGKNLAKHATEIAITFRRTPHLIFRNVPEDQVDSNVLSLRIQPDEGISLKFVAKLPGQYMNIRPVKMDFRYGTTFGPHLASAYERLILDCALGDPTLFDRVDSVETAWGLVQPILEAWSDGNIPLHEYPSGSWGPAESDRLIGRDNRQWRLI